MYYNEHGVPHFHAEHQGESARFSFEGKMIGGNLRSRTALRLISEWTLAHRNALEANWIRIERGEPLQKIPPLE